MKELFSFFLATPYPPRRKRGRGRRSQGSNIRSPSFLFLPGADCCTGAWNLSNYTVALAPRVVCQCSSKPTPNGIIECFSNIFFSCQMYLFVYLCQFISRSVKLTRRTIFKLWAGNEKRTGNEGSQTASVASRRTTLRLFWCPDYVSAFFFTSWELTKNRRQPLQLNN